MGAQIPWGTSRWINNAHFSSGMLLLLHERHCNWPYWKLPECSALKTQTTAPRLLCTFLIYPPWCMSKVIVMSLNDVRIICFLLFSRKGTAHVQESCTDLPATPTSIPTNYFLQLCMNHVLIFVSQILSLWHILYIYLTFAYDLIAYLIWLCIDIRMRCYWMKQFIMLI